MKPLPARNINLSGPLTSTSPGPIAIIREDPGEINQDERNKYQQLKIDLLQKRRVLYL